KLDTRALIPRPETEGLVELVLNWTRRVPRGTWHVERGGGGVAAAGAGCGCVGRALAVHGSLERVTVVVRAAGVAGAARGTLAPGGLLALEIDERRAVQVRALARAHGWARVAIHEDLFGRSRFLLAFAKEGA